MSPVMVDLFCGRGGWTKGFQAHGWHCIGIDLNPQPEYPGEFIQADIAQLIELPPADFYCCSSPCEQFSVHGMKHFHPNPKWPWLGIALFEHARQLIEATGKPYVMENVRAAQRFMGRSDYRFGSFHLWGNCFSRMWPWPPELMSCSKGYHMRRDDPKFCMDKRERAALLAVIPQSLSSHIAQKAGSL